jgi:hypothetical protein
MTQSPLTIDLRSEKESAKRRTKLIGQLEAMVVGSKFNSSWNLNGSLCSVSHCGGCAIVGGAWDS